MIYERKRKQIAFERIHIYNPASQLGLFWTKVNMESWPMSWPRDTIWAQNNLAIHDQTVGDAVGDAVWCKGMRSHLNSVESVLGIYERLSRKPMSNVLQIAEIPSRYGPHTMNSTLWASRMYHKGKSTRKRSLEQRSTEIGKRLRNTKRVMQLNLSKLMINGSRERCCLLPAEKRSGLFMTQCAMGDHIDVAVSWSWQWY